MKIRRGFAMKKYFGYCLIIAILALTGCIPQIVYTSEPTIQKKSNNYFEASISPILQDTDLFFGDPKFTGFNLSINNMTDNNLEIIWDKTLYIYNGTTSGGFMFEGVVYKDRNNPKSPDIVFANSSFSKNIYPSNLVSFESGSYGGWRNGAFNIGEHGVYLTVKVNGQEVNEKLTVNISGTPEDSK